jgi:hypothetical protein
LKKGKATRIARISKGLPIPTRKTLVVITPFIPKLKLRIKIKMKGYLFKITCLSLLTFSFAITSCKNQEKLRLKPPKKGKIKEKVADNGSSTGTSVDVTELLDQYIKTLQTNKIKLVDSATCGKYEQNQEQYFDGILVYNVTQINKLQGDINDDNEKDFVVTYFAENCWGGIGVGNYLTNIFFIISEQGNYAIDEKTTMKFKQKFIDETSKMYKENVYKKAEKYEAMNDITFKIIKDGKGYGEFSILQCGIIPCLSGKFEYNFKTNELTLKDVMKYEEQ